MKHLAHYISRSPTIDLLPTHDPYIFCVPLLRKVHQFRFTQLMPLCIRKTHHEKELVPVSFTHEDAAIQFRHFSSDQFVARDNLAEEEG